MGLSHIGLISCTVYIIDIATMDMLYCYYYYNINNDGLLWWACGVRVEILWRYLGDTLRRLCVYTVWFSFVFTRMGTFIIKLI